jgi:hypothetical protein
MARGYICLAVAACLLTASSSTHQIGLTTSDPGAPCLAHSIRRGLSTENLVEQHKQFLLGSDSLLPVGPS